MLPVVLQGVALRCVPCQALLLNAQAYRQHMTSKVGSTEGGVLGCWNHCPYWWYYVELCVAMLLTFLTPMCHLSSSTLVESAVGPHSSACHS
jgi:hypothetical protein